MKHPGRSGFTLMELVVVIIIIAILAAVAWPSYERFIERMRMADVLTLIGTERAAQDRHMLTRHRYTDKWTALDAVPVEVHSPVNTDGSGNGYLSADGTVFYTRGGADLPDESRKPGFAVKFEERAGKWFFVADRVGTAWGGYQYAIVRSFEDNQAVCVPNQSHENSVLICMDFMGVDLREALPPDPRTLVTEPDED